jgi:Lipoxygenase
MATREVKGKLLRSKLESTPDKKIKDTPYRDTRIEIWDRDFLLNDQLGVAITDDEGNFCLKYDTDDAGELSDLMLKVFRLNAKGESELIFNQDGGRDVDFDFDFGEIRIFDWEYDPQYPVPLIRTPSAGIFASPQDFVPIQFRKIIAGGVKFQALRFFGDQASDISSVQNFFPKNLTMTQEDSRTDNFFVDAVLNRFAPAMFTKDSSGDFHVRYSIDNYVWDGKQQAPNVHLILDQNASGNLNPVKIEWSIRDKTSNTIVDSGSASPTGNVTDWDKAKEFFRISEFIDGEVKGHLGRSHINVGQYAIVLYRNIQKNPILKLLHPHLKEVTAINSFGKGIIFGSEGILSTSPLKQESVIEVLRDDLGSCNWKQWSPRKSINNQHSYASIHGLYWEILNEYINDFFATYIDKIILDWKEIYYFSQDLVNNSVPFKSPGIVAGETWYCNNEISADPGTGKAISDITTVKINPPASDIDNLKQVCAYAIYHATIWHDWRNDYQADYGGEIEYARLSLNYEVKDASFQLFIMNILSSIDHGYILKNEEGDIPELFISKLKSRIQDFKNFGYDLRDLRSRINI